MKIPHQSVVINIFFTLGLFCTISLIGGKTISLINAEPHRLKRSTDSLSSFDEVIVHRTDSNFSPENTELSLIHRKTRSLVEAKGRSYPGRQSYPSGRKFPRGRSFQKGRSYPKGRNFPPNGRTNSNAKSRLNNHFQGRDVFNWNINTKGNKEDELDDEDDGDKSKNTAELKGKEIGNDTQKSKEDDPKHPEILTGIVGDGADVSVGENAGESEVAKSTAADIEELWSDIYDDEDKAGLASMDKKDPFLDKLLASVLKVPIPSTTPKTSGLSLLPQGNGTNGIKGAKPLADQSGNKLVTVNLPVKSQGGDKEISPGNPQTYVVYKDGKPFLFVGILIPL